jgi:putative transposase
MRLMGLRALYPRRRTSQPGKGHTIYPYLLRDLCVERANQVWASDICYLPMAKGFMYLVAIMDWHTRRVLSWRVSNTLDSEFCVEALEEALERFGPPEIFNTDQGRAVHLRGVHRRAQGTRHRDQYGRQRPVGG